MDGYTRKFFFGEIEEILDARPIDEIKPILVYRDTDGVVAALHWSGNKAVGDIEDFVFAEVGLLARKRDPEATLRKSKTC